jgi:teichuronic acid biosynthesis glycosyltransferase TuaC
MTQPDGLVSFIRSSVDRAHRRVLFVTNMWPEEQRRWYGTFIKTQAQSLERIGVAVDVLYARGHARRRAYGLATRVIGRFSRNGAYDLVHAHYGHSGVVGRLQWQRPFVLSYCGNDLLPFHEGKTATDLIRGPLEITAFRQLARLCDATITKSDEMERRLPAACRVRNHVIPNGVDLSSFDALPKAAARERLGWAPHHPVVLFVGNPQERRKNYPIAQRTCERLSVRIANLELRVAWRVPHSHVALWMSAADALLFPSSCEGSPNVIKEAMAAELPIVATPVGDIEERLRGLPGCFVRPADPVALAEALATALRHGRVPEARRAVLELSLENVARRVNAVYDKVLAPTRSRRMDGAPSGGSSASRPRLQAALENRSAARASRPVLASQDR